MTPEDQELIDHLGGISFTDDADHDWKDKPELGDDPDEDEDVDDDTGDEDDDDDERVEDDDE